MVFQSILTTFLFVLCFNYYFINILAEEESFYTLLGVDQDVDLLTIRKAFKRLAILKHPDKNPHDPDAHSLFVRINRAYEVLKDDDLRQKYDQFGEKGLEDNGGGDHQYQSWQFYNDNFGIYDEDPEIITLGRGDFEEVFQSGEIWFVNFYSAYCSHCHTLAPVWRELAKRVPEGVARIGAVNCAEDPQLCRSQNVMGYPSLIVYPQQEWFEGERKLDNLLNFLLSQISVSILQPTHALPPQRPLLLELCLFNENDCLSEEERKKIAAISNQLLIQFVLLDCSGFAKELCNTFGAQEGMFLLSGDENEKPKELYFADLTDLRLQLLSELPELDELTSVEFNQLLNRKNINTDQESTLIIFINSKEEEQKEWRRLPIIFPQIDVKIVNCFVKDIKHLCDNMHLGKLPRSAIFKSNGGYDLNYGNVQTNIREIIKFIRHSLNSNLIVLNYDTYWEARQSANSSDLWLIDHFATWCPPCIKMLDELRKLNSELNEGLRLHIGTIDCDAFRGICSQERINSYPRTMLFTGDSNQKQQHSLVGFHTVDQLLEFISEALNPSVETLTPDNFDQIVYSSGHSFFIDFFAPWCGPCQKLAPEFRQLARQWAATHKQQQNPIVFASVDCEEYSGLCNRENVHSFPALRLYRQINEGGKIDIIHYPSNWWRNAQTMSHWLSEMMPSLVQKIAGDFANTVLDSSEPFLIDFYAPWCSHCVQFAPVFEQLAQLLNGKIRLGKVDCERFSWICSNAQVNYFPQILLYFGTNKYKRQNSRGIEIEHGMDAEIIAKNVIEKLEEYGNLNERDEL